MTSYQQTDWDQKRPTNAELASTWKSIELQPLDRARPVGLRRYLAAWSSVLKNGRVAFAQFQLPMHPTLAFYLARNRFADCGFVNNLVKRLSLVAPVPEFLQKPRRLKELNEVDPLMLDGMLAGRLVWGGAYASFREREKRAKKIGVDASRAIIGDRYSLNDFWIAETTEKWSPWFLGIAWDSTFFVFDKKRAILSILVGTDTD